MEDPSVSSVSKEGKEIVEEQIGVSDETLKKIADTLLRDESIKTYNVTELFVDEESGQIMEKKVRCLKGSSLFDWFMDEKNQKKLGVQIRGEADVAVVMELMMEQGYFHKAEKIEVKGERGKIIQRVKSTDYQRHKALYVWDYEGSQFFKKLRSALVLLAMFLIPTYNLWPLIIKRILLYTIGGIAGALLALNVLRLLVFCLCWFFGYYVWIFPNLNNEKLGVVDSFFPLISCEKDKSGKVLYRVLALLAIVSVATVLVLYPNEVRRAYRKTQRFAEKQMVRVSHLPTQIKTSMLHLYESVVEKIYPSPKQVHRKVFIKEEKIVEDSNGEEEDEDIEDVEEIDLDELEDIRLLNEL